MGMGDRKLAVLVRSDQTQVRILDEHGVAQTKVLIPAENDVLNRELIAVKGGNGKDRIFAIGYGKDFARITAFDVTRGVAVNQWEFRGQATPKGGQAFSGALMSYSGFDPEFYLFSKSSIF